MVLVGQDVINKARATRIALGALQRSGADDYQGLTLLETLESAPLDGRGLMRVSKEFLSEAESKHKVGSANGNGSATEDRMSGLLHDLATYFYYAATVVEFFGPELGEGELKHAEQTGALEALARARQLLAVDPRVSLTLIERFRQAHGLGPAQAQDTEPPDANGRITHLQRSRDVSPATRAWLSSI